jgi:hypothetical protein
MRGKIQLRHILPVCFTVLYAVLIFAANREEQAIRNHPPPPQLISDLQPYRTPLAAQWALAINLPAVIASMPVFLMIWKISPHVSDLVIYAIIGLFVPLLWFLVGRWLDNVLGLLPAKSNPKRSPLAVLGCVSFLAIDGFVVFVMVNERFYELNFMGMVVWLGFAALWFYMRMRRASPVAEVRTPS